MRRLAAISCLLIVVCLCPIDAKVFQKCALAKLLDSYQISRSLISNCKYDLRQYQFELSKYTIIFFPRDLHGKCRKWRRYLEESHFGQSNYQLWDLSGKAMIQSQIFIPPQHSVNPFRLQINSKDWCRAGRKGGKCNKNCEGESRLNASIILRTPLGGAVEFYDHLLIISENSTTLV